MTEEKTKKFYALFEEMVDQITQPEHFDRASFVNVLTRICELFHIAKGVTEFYPSLKNEQDHDGEILIDYDNGHGEVEVIRKRIVTRSRTVLIGTLYRAKDEPPLDEEELEKLDLLERTLLSFLTRNRLVRVTERLGFYDENMYPNFRYFLRYLEIAQEQGKLTGMTVGSVNLRRFGLINQEIGRPLGDVVMHGYWEQLRQLIGERGVVTRIGGDNFAVAFEKDLLQPVLDLMQGTSVEYDKENERHVMVFSSIGLYDLPKDFVMNGPGILMDHIMEAMNAARRGFNGNVVFYDDDLRSRRQAVQRLQGEFPKALQNREFQVYYQPKVHVETGEIAGAEALCRWIRDGKIVPPGDFIPILEGGIEVCELDYYMLERVCEDVARWLKEGRDVVRISVNFSRKHLVETDMLEHILAVVDKHNVPHEYIEIELTETTTDVGFTDLKRVVLGLRSEGIYTAVDDFGMGYSSLNLIREIPWHVIKIDRSILPATESEESSITGRMYRHVANMIRDLGMECVTEGVETKRQVAVLRNNKCFIAQGFYFDRPLPVEEFERRLEQKFYPL